MKSFAQFRLDHPLGSRIADPLLIGNGETAETCYQCVSLIKKYWEECKGITCNWPGNAIHLWTQTKPEILAGFNQESNSNAQEGDIVVLWGVNGNAYGHVGIATGNVTATQIEILEQNGATGGGTGRGNDAIRTRYVDRSRVAGLLRPKVPVQPASAPPTPASYSVVATYPEGKQIVLNKDTNLWGMNYHFDFMVAHPVEQNHTRGEIWTVTNKVHHENGYDYYRRDGQVDGFNVLDCDDYTPPPPPYVPPAEPLKGKPVRTYPLDWEVPSFDNPIDAMSHRNAKGSLKPKTYIIFEEDDLAYNLTENNMVPGVWINTKDNVPPLPPEPKPLPEQVTVAIQNAKDVADTLAQGDTKDMATSWKQCTPLKVDKHTGKWLPVKYVSTNDLVQNIRSLDGQIPTTIPLPPHKVLNLVSTFISPDGTLCARDDTLTTSHRYYALPFSLFKPFVEARTSPLDVNKDGQLTYMDFIDFSSKLFTSGKAVVSTAAKTIQTEKVRRLVDGITRKVK